MGEFEYDSPPSRPRKPRKSRVPLVGTLIGLGVISLAAFLFVLWFVVRVEVKADEILVLVNKTGRAIPGDLSDEFQDQVVLYPELVKTLAAKTGMAEEKVRTKYKGIQYEYKQAGRYFPNPYSYKTVKMPMTIIDQNEVGVLIRKYGKPLPFPKTVATEPDERGPVAEVLKPGRYPVNLLAYDVQVFPRVYIPPGHVGVVTLLSGNEPRESNTYTVNPGEKGVQRKTLVSGYEYYNPYLEKIDIVDIRNRTYHMLGKDAIHFPSNDSFTITIEGTIEWSIDADRVAEITVAFGDEEDIINKIILPYARSISRIEGSKLQARDFISGKTRLGFQKRLLEQLQEECEKRGVEIHSALVREILPPPEIARLISQREQADQEIERSRNQIAEAEAEARLVEQREMQSRNAALGEARRKTVAMVKEAEQRQVIKVTQANRQLEVAKLNLQAATKEAAAIVSRGQANANVILFEYKARAEPLKNAVNAFGDGTTYAQHFYLQKIAPSIESVLSNTDGPFAKIFESFQQVKGNPVSTGSQGGAQ